MLAFRAIIADYVDFVNKFRQLLRKKMRKQENYRLAACLFVLVAHPRVMGAANLSAPGHLWAGDAHVIRVHPVATG